MQPSSNAIYDVLSGLDTETEDREQGYRPLALYVLCATSQQKDQKQNRNGDSQEPEQNVSSRSCFFRSIGQMHRGQSFLWLLIRVSYVLRVGPGELKARKCFCP